MICTILSDLFCGGRVADGMVVVPRQEHGKGAVAAKLSHLYTAEIEMLQPSSMLLIVTAFEIRYDDP